MFFLWKIRDYIQRRKCITFSAQGEMVIRPGQRSATGQWRQRLIDADWADPCWVGVSSGGHVVFYLFIFFKFYHWSMYWAYSITLYCTATYREYHIGTVKFVIHNHFHDFQYSHWLLKSSWRCPGTQRCSLDMSLTLCYSSMPFSDYLKMVGMDEYATVKM